VTKTRDDITPKSTEVGEVAAARPMLAARLIEEVEVALEAYVGEARMSVAALNAMKVGSSVTLDAALNRAVDLKLNGVTVARGELVAVGDNFGVRLTEIAE
jgi:flagellar motor switch protein FliN/FliY